MDTHSCRGPIACHLACQSIDIVGCRGLDLWSYVNSDTSLMDIGPAVTNAWHTAYLYSPK